MFTIKPLSWKLNMSGHGWAAQTPFGEYSIDMDGRGVFMWGYDFGQFDKKQVICKSLAEGKRLAFANWESRLSHVLIKVVSNTDA